LRLVGIVIGAMLLAGAVTVVTLLLKILSIAFAPGVSPIVVDFSGVAFLSAVLLAALFVALILAILLGYIPTVIRGEEEV